MSNPIYYRLHTATGSLTLRSERFVELYALMLETPKSVFDLQLGNLGRVSRVEWSGNKGDWIEMSKGSVGAAFAKVLIGWARAEQLLPIK